MNMFINKCRSQHGVALIAVLWVLAFLATIASTVAHQSRSSLQITKNRIDQLKVKQAAESAVLFIVADLINAPSGDLYTQDLLNSEYQDINIKLSYFDEAGKVDLNSVPASVMVSLLNVIGVADEQSLMISDAILDWRDEDNLKRIDGAEDNDYAASGYLYGSSDAEFERIEELKLVYGMNEEIYNAISPYVTVYTQDYGVNLSVASNVVQTAVNNATTLGEIDSSVTDDNEVDEDDIGEDERFTSLTQGYIYTIKAIATTESGVSHEISTTVRLDRGNIYEPFTILKWMQI
ncbi:MAG: general secretion pathway protein GspK [Gammaproteobacteria bacterium]